MRLLSKAWATPPAAAPDELSRSGARPRGRNRRTKYLAIIKREKNKAFWCRLNYALGKQVRGQSVWAVQVEDGAGGVLDLDTEEAVQKAIFNEVHRKRSNLAEEAPICQGALCGQFGYTATSPTARSVLDGTYKFPPDGCRHQGTV